MHGNAFLYEKFGHAYGNVLILTHDQSGCGLDHRDFAAKAAIHLRKFKPNVTAAKNDQMLRHKIYVHNRTVGEIGNLI
jgi:hypothetical protein